MSQACLTATLTADDVAMRMALRCSVRWRCGCTNPPVDPSKQQLQSAQTHRSILSAGRQSEPFQFLPQVGQQALYLCDENLLCVTVQKSWRSNRGFNRQMVVDAASASWLRSQLHSMSDTSAQTCWTRCSTLNHEATWISVSALFKQKGSKAAQVTCHRP